MSLINENELFLLGELVKKNFSSKYKDSVLGVLWTILHPLLLMVLFTIIFSTIFKRNIENYPVYFLCGWCVFVFFNNSINSSMRSLKGNKNILLRNPVPKHIFILGGIISEFLTFIIMLVLLLIIMIITQAPFYVTILFSFIPIISLLIMISGFGLMLSVISVYYSDVLHLWTILSMIIMYSSAIFYPMEIIPEFYRQYLMLNPLYWIIDQFRFFVYHGSLPPFELMINSILLSLIIFVLGLIVFKKYENRITMKF